MLGNASVMTSWGCRVATEQRCVTRGSFPCVSVCECVCVCVCVCVCCSYVLCVQVLECMQVCVRLCLRACVHYVFVCEF